MFKIKKSTRKVPTRDPLAENNPNEESLPDQKFKGRPQSVRLNRKQMSQYVIGQQQQQESNEASQQNILSSQNRTVEAKIMDRDNLEENIRRLGAAIFKDRIALYGEFKEIMIKRVAEKTIFREQMLQQDWQEYLRPVIVREMERLERGRQLQRRCEDRVTRIQNLLSDRLLKLGSFR